MKTIRLDKKLVLRLYYFTWQACRSLHKGLGGPWEDFREFYGPDRINCLQELIGTLRSLVGPRHRAYRFGDDEIDWRGGWLVFLQSLPGGRLLSRWKKTFAFSDEQLDYLAFLLDAFIQVVDLQEKPEELKGLISLRMALFDCASLLDQGGASELVRCHEQIDHFWRANRTKPVYLDDLLYRAGLPAGQALAIQHR